MARYKKGQSLPHQAANNFDENYEWYLRFKKFKKIGEGGANVPTPVNFVKIPAANYTGEQIYIGQVCEFDGNPFPDPDLTEQYPDPRSDRWVRAVTPDLTHNGWGIALDPIPGFEGSDREGGDFLVNGVCHARVIITDESHLFARREAGQRSLQSSERGAVKLLHVGSATGNPNEYLCLVHILDDTPNWYVGIVREDYQQGTTEHGIFVDIYKRDLALSRWRKIANIVLEAEDWFLNEGELLEKLTKVRVDWHINCWVVTSMYCSPTDLDEFQPTVPQSPGEMEANIQAAMQNAYSQFSPYRRGGEGYMPVIEPSDAIYQASPTEGGSLF